MIDIVNLFNSYGKLIFTRIVRKIVLIVQFIKGRKTNNNIYYKSVYVIIMDVF